MKSIAQKQRKAQLPRKRLYKKLRIELRRLDYTDAAGTLASWINRSYSYASSCLAGRNSFRPAEIRIILAELGRSEEDAALFFPALGIDKEEAV